MRHRLRMAGVMVCGKTEARDGAAGTMAIKLVTCPACIAITNARRAEAKARAAKAGVA